MGEKVLGEDEDIFALSGGNSRTGAQVFRGPERAVKALIRHYRRHSGDGNWNVAFVRLSPGETQPVSLTKVVRPIFDGDSGTGRRLRAGSQELSEWESRMSKSLLEKLSV